MALDYFKEALSQRPHKKVHLMIEIRGRMPSITNFEGDVMFHKIERGEDIEIRVDPLGSTLSTKSKMYIPSGLERVVRNGDQFYFESGLKCQVVDVLEAYFTVRAKE